MKRRILSIISSVAVFVMMLTVSIVHVEASGTETKKVDGSYLTTEESSTGYSYNRARGIIEQDRDNGFRSTIQRNVNNLEEIEKSEVAREAKENKDLSKNYQKKDGPVK